MASCMTRAPPRNTRTCSPPTARSPSPRAGPAIVKGRQALIAQARRDHERFGNEPAANGKTTSIMRHLISNAQITITGADTATGTCYVTTVVKKGDIGPAILSISRYTDRYAKQDGRVAHPAARDHDRVRQRRTGQAARLRWPLMNARALLRTRAALVWRGCCWGSPMSFLPSRCRTSALSVWAALPRLADDINTRAPVGATVQRGTGVFTGLAPAGQTPPASSRCRATCSPPRISTRIARCGVIRAIFAATACRHRNALGRSDCRRARKNPPASAPWGYCDRDYPRSSIVSPYPFRTAQAHYEALLAETRSRGGPDGAHARHAAA